MTAKSFGRNRGDGLLVRNKQARGHITTQGYERELKSRPGPLALEEGLLSRDSPSIAGEAAIGAKNAMAWDGDGQGIGRASAGDRAGGAGRPDAMGDVGIAGGRTRGDGAESVPDALLERGAARIERIAEPGSRFLDETDHGAGLRSRTGFVRRAGETLFEVPSEFLAVVAEENRTYAATGSGDSDEAEGALIDRILNGAVSRAGTAGLRFLPG